MFCTLVLSGVFGSGAVVADVLVGEVVGESIMTSDSCCATAAFGVAVCSSVGLLHMSLGDSIRVQNVKCQKRDKSSQPSERNGGNKKKDGLPSFFFFLSFGSGKD